MENLRSHREALGLSQIRLARLAGVSRFRISVHESGDGELTAEEQGRIRAALKAEAQRLASIADTLGRVQEAGADGGAVA